MQTHFDGGWGSYLLALAAWWYLFHGGLALTGPRLTWSLQPPSLSVPAAEPPMTDRLAASERTREEILQWLRQFQY